MVSSSTTGTVARVERSGRFLPPPRRGRVSQSWEEEVTEEADSAQLLFTMSQRLSPHYGDVLFFHDV